jgi:hypothetical protein
MAAAQQQASSCCTPALRDTQQRSLHYLAVTCGVTQPQLTCNWHQHVHSSALLHATTPIMTLALCSLLVVIAITHLLHAVFPVFLQHPAP